MNILEALRSAWKSLFSVDRLIRIVAIIHLILVVVEIAIVVLMWTYDNDSLIKFDFTFIRIGMNAFLLVLLIVVVLHIYFVYFKYDNSKLATDQAREDIRDKAVTFLAVQTTIRVIYLVWVCIALAYGVRGQPWITPTMISFAIFGASITIVALIVAIRCADKLTPQDHPAFGIKQLSCADQPKESIAPLETTQQVIAVDEEKAASVDPMLAIQGGANLYLV